MRPTIVFADNDRGIRRYCKLELKAAGYHVLLAVDGLDALELVRAKAVDLVILDVNMPRCTGLEAARRIRQRHPDLPIILFTANLDFLGQEGPSVDAVIIKSEDLTPLKAAIDRLLHSRIVQDWLLSVTCKARRPLSNSIRSWRRRRSLRGGHDSFPT